MPRTSRTRRPAAPVPGVFGLTPPEPARLLFLDDVHARLPKRADGQPRFSREWARVHVAPDAKRLAGRCIYWLETDVLAWERAYFASAERLRSA